MRNRVNGYLAALEKNELTKYHDKHDVLKGRMRHHDYVVKWGNRGFKRRRRNDETMS